MFVAVSAASSGVEVFAAVVFVPVERREVTFRWVDSIWYCADLRLLRDNSEGRRRRGWSCVRMCIRWVVWWAGFWGMLRLGCESLALVCSL